MPDNSQNEYQEFMELYGQIKRDIRKVVLTNVLILAFLIGLYFADQRLGFLDQVSQWLRL